MPALPALQNVLGEEDEDDEQMNFAEMVSFKEVLRSLF